MKTKNNPRLLLINTLITLTLTQGLHAAELVTNGDFSANANDFSAAPGYAGGDNPANPTGWTLSWTPGAGSGAGVNGSSAPHSPFAPGNNVPSFLFLQGDSATVSQALATTNGGNYLFSFDAAARNLETSGINVFANDTQPASLVLNGLGGNNGWLSSSSFQRYAFGFTATGAQTIRFSGSGTGDHTTDITNVSVTDTVSSKLNIANGTLFFTETSGTRNYGFSLTGTNQTIYRRPGSATYTGNVTTDGSAGALSITAYEDDGLNNLTFSGSSLTLGAKSLNVTGIGIDSTLESLNTKVTLTNSTLTTNADVSVGRGSLEITGSTSLTIGGQLRSGSGGDWSTFIMNPGTSVTATGGVDLTVNGVVAANLFLNGGTLTTPFIRGARFNVAGNSNLIFNGTTVVASANSADFLQVRLDGGSNMYGPALIAAGGAIFDTNGKNITIQNTLENDGASQGTITKQGLGTLRLTGANTYPGDTTVTGGSLAVNGSSIADANKLIINGGKVDLTDEETVDTLFFGGVQQIAGTYSATGAGGTIASANFTGSGTLVVTTGSASPYTTWANSFLPGNDVSNPAGDNDNDGLTNQQEFAFGLSPISGSSVNPIVAQLNKTAGQFSYQRLAASGLTYKILTSTTLATGSWIEDTTAGQVATAIPSTDNESVVVTLTGAPLAASKLFVRVAAE